MTFSCAELLSNSYRYNLWGEHVCPSITESITIQGRITGDVSNDSVVMSWEVASGLITGASGVTPIYVNGLLLGTGRVISIDFDSSSDINDRVYNANIEILRLAGPDLYDNISTNTLPSSYSGRGGGYYRFFFTETGRLISDIVEDYQFNNNGSGKYNYERSVSFSINDEINDIYGVDAGVYARRLINEIKTSYCDINTITHFYPDFYKSGSGVLYTRQSFDEINNRFSYSENFLFSTGLNYTWNYTNNISLNNGIFSITEDGEIISNRESSYFNRLSNAELAWSSIEIGIFDRCVSIVSDYTGVFLYTGDCPLRQMPESDSVSRDFCLGKISYTRAYSNNPFNNSGYVHNYGWSVDTDNDGYLRVSENGSIQANPRNALSFSEVYSLYTGMLDDISGRIYSSYTGYKGSIYSCNYSSDIYELSHNLVIEEYDKKISYSVNYTDNLSFLDPSFFTFKTSTSDTIPTHVYHYYPVVNDKIYSAAGFQSTRGSFSNSVLIESKEPLLVSEYLSLSTGSIVEPSGTDVVPHSFTWNYEPLSNVFTANVVYNYTRHRGESNFLV